jgi:hypothetical protein
MIREYVIEISEHYTNQFKLQLAPSYYETILEIATNQMKSTNNWLQNNLDSISFYESQVAGNEIASFAQIVTFLRESNISNDITSRKSEHIKLIYDIYEKYEYKFRGEYLTKSSEEQNEYIEYLLMPIYCIYLYIQNEVK